MKSKSFILVVDDISTATHLDAGSLPKELLTTTFIWKRLKGTRVITGHNGKKVISLR